MASALLRTNVLKLSTRSVWKRLYSEKTTTAAATTTATTTTTTTTAAAAAAAAATTTPAAAVVDEPVLTRKEKLLKMVDNYYQDYKIVAIETKDHMKEHPFKTGFYLLGLGILYLFHKSVPDEDSFKEKVRESANDLALLAKVIRNPDSDEFIRSITKSQNKKRLHYIHLGFFSLVYYSDFGEGVDLFEAHCRHLQPKYLDYRDRIVDIGLLGRWIWIQQFMFDYDINPEEWSLTPADSSSFTQLN